MAGSGYRDWVAGDVPTAAQFDTYLQEQTVMVFASAAARDAALTTVKAEGMTCKLLDENREYTYDGAAWQRTGWWASTGRTGVTALRNAAQSIASDTTTAISWDAETGDSDGFLTPTSTTVTIPSGLGGLYAITARVVASVGLTGVAITAGGIAYSVFVDNAIGDTHAYSLTMPLNAADTIQFSVRHITGSPTNVTGAMFVYRIGL